MENALHTPAIILVEPQMGENIGAAARAMLNCGLTDLRLVRPRDGWPNERADAMSSGALAKMPPVRIFETTAEAMADCRYTYATTARPREMDKPVFTAHGAAEDSIKRTGQKIGFLFGPERAGLNNEDVALAHAVITIPINPEFSSLNLAQCVLLVAYEWYQASGPSAPSENAHLPAPHEKLNELFERMETELQEHGFFRSPEQKPTLMRNLKSMLGRAEMSEQEIRTFQGIITALTTGNKKGR